MADIFANHSGRHRRSQRTEGAGVRPGALALACLLVVIAIGVGWFYHAGRRGAAVGREGTNPALAALSDTTLATLQKLDSELEIRFYSVLDPASVPESQRAFANRVDQLLSAYQQAAGGKIRLTRFTSQPDLNSRAAPADGIQPFNMDKGEACYLGIALAFKGRKEVLPQLAPEWEGALEADVTRAIIRLEDAGRAASNTTASLARDTNIVQEVKALIPDLGAVSLEEGTRILREAALKDLAAAAQEMEAQIKDAQQRLIQAQNGGSDADQQAAMNHLQQVQAEQGEKFKRIAARSRVQIEALNQLKASAH